MSIRILNTRYVGFAFVVLLLLLCEAASRAGALDPRFVPPVSRVLERFVTLIGNGVIPTSFAHTLGRLSQGYIYASVLGVGLGMLIGVMPAVYRTLETLLELLRPLPTAALIPIVMLFLGLGDGMKVFVIAWACFFPILLNTVYGVRSIENTLLDTGRTFRFDRLRTFFRLILPAASPVIATGLRLSLGLSLILAVTTELVAGENGIGYFILQVQRSFRAADMYAGVMALGVVGYLLNRIFLLVEGRLLAWHHGLTLRQHEN